MNKHGENMNSGYNDQPLRVDESVERKQFVEPDISAPVDVLEATTFFQIGSGGTDPNA